MTEENRRQAKKVRQALEELLDRLAKAVFDSLGRSKQGGHPRGRRPARPPGGRAKSSE